MPNETRKKWINSEVLKCLSAAHMLLEIAIERANESTPDEKMPIMPAAYRDDLARIKWQINVMQSKFSIGS